MKKLRIPIIIAVTVVLLLGTVFGAYALSNAKPKVLPPTSKVQGLTYGEWLAKWWQYALSIPAPQNPIIGGIGANCAFQRIGDVGLVLADSMAGVPINCEVPAGMKLYFEVLGAECSTLEEAPFYGGNEAELLACAQALVPQDLQASLDGVTVPNLSKYFSTSPLYEFTVPEDNALETPGSASGKSIGSGVYLMLAPLSPGKHTIHLQGTYPTLDYTADKTFHLTVTR